MRTSCVSLVSLAALGSAAVALAPTARAGGARILDAGLGYPAYATPQAAIDAAPNGATILVGGGTYPGVTIANKSIFLDSMPGASVNLQGPVVITGADYSKAVVLSGLQVTLDAAHDSVPALQVTGGGFIRFENCSFHAYDRGFGFCFGGGGQILPGAPGAVLQHVPRAVFRACSITGGKGDSVDESDDSCVCGIGDGGAGLQILDFYSDVLLYDCSIAGGPGGGAEGCQGRGGIGLSATWANVFVSASSITGGAGGPSWSPPPACGGHGGDGVALQNMYSFRIIASSSTGGFGSCGASGIPYSGGLPVVLPGPAARAAFGPSVQSELSPLSIAYEGAALDDVLLFVGPRNPPTIDTGARGPLLVKAPGYMPIFELGTANGSGVLATSITMPSLSAGSGSLRTMLQVGSSNAYGITPGSSQSLLVLDRQSGPDCDGDGLNDFVELIENPSLDADQNLVPDGCPGG